jgi:outer membrane protein TolC
MPKLGIEGNWQRLDEISVVTFGDREIPLGSLDNRTADLVLTQPLDIFGIVRAGRKTAKYNMSAAGSGYDQVTNDTILQAKKAYFEVLRKQKWLFVQQGLVQVLEAHLKDAKAHLAAGTVAPFEVLRAETQLANAKPDLIIAENELELAKSALNNVLGRPHNTPVELEELDKPLFVDLELTKCVDSACAYRPEVRQAESQVQASGEMTKVAKLLGKPRFNFRWAYNKSFDVSTFSPRDASWQAFLTTSISLYDGGATSASVAKAQADASTAKSMQEQVVRTVTLDTQQSYLSLKESRERIQAAEKALEQARESMRLADVRYKGGVSTQVELFDAQSALTLSDTNYVNGLYDYQVSLAKVEHAVGGPTHMAKLLSDTPAVKQAAK